MFRLSLTHTFLFISHPGSTELLRKAGCSWEDVPKQAMKRRSRQHQPCWPSASSLSGTIAPLAWASFSFLSSHCVPLFLSRSCENHRPTAPHGPGRINAFFSPRCTLSSAVNAIACTLQQGVAGAKLSVWQRASTPRDCTSHP